MGFLAFVLALLRGELSEATAAVWTHSVSAVIEWTAESPARPARSPAAFGPFDVHERIQLDGDCALDGLAYGAIDRAKRRAIPRVAGNSPGSFCAVSHEHRFIFVHVLKNAGSRTKTYLASALCGGNMHTCSKKVLQYAPCALTMRQFPEYYRWTWARNPIRRAASVFAMARSMGLPRAENFSVFWRDSHRFDESRMNKDHGLPQTLFLRDKHGCFGVDYVGRLENAATELGVIFKRLRAKPLEQYFAAHGFPPPADWNMGTQLVDSGQVDLAEAMRDCPTRKAILDLYAADCKVLGCPVPPSPRPNHTEPAKPASKQPVAHHPHVAWGLRPGAAQVVRRSPNRAHATAAPVPQLPFPAAPPVPLDQRMAFAPVPDVQSIFSAPVPLEAARVLLVPPAVADPQVLALRVPEAPAAPAPAVAQAALEPRAAAQAALALAPAAPAPAGLRGR